MPHFICTTCGTQHAESAEPPAHCAICDDERQYVGADGQRWTTLDALRRGHRNAFRRYEPGLYGIGTTPNFAINQRALLVRTPWGNVLWDCVALLDDATADIILALGGLRAVAISHPHYYTTNVEWARAFHAPVYLHAADRAHVMRPDDDAQFFWEGETHVLGDGVTLVRCGGHFDGGTVLHWAGGADGRGVLLSGDIIQVAQDPRWVSFMYSYPNMIPLPPSVVRRIVRAIEPFEFDRLYGAWWDRETVEPRAKDVIRRSAERYARFAADAAPTPVGA